MERYHSYQRVSLDADGIDQEGRQPVAHLHRSRHRGRRPAEPRAGRAKVYVDGVYIQTINMRTKSSTSRLVAFTRAFPGGGVHRIKVVVVGLDPARLFRLDAFVVSQ